MAKVSCVIPAHNEAKRIDKVLEIVSGHPLINQITVVDDGSSDQTDAVVREFKDIELIVLPKNMGKSHAVSVGVENSKGDYLLFLDSDLVGLTAQNVSDLINPIISGEADVSISLRKNAPPPWPQIGLDYISGERVVPQRFAHEHLVDLPKLARFGLEVFMNKWIIKNKCRIKVVRWPNVISPLKSKKHGFWAGVKGDALMMRDIFKTISVLEALRQIIKMISLKV